jgi:MFS family permease
MSAKLAGKLLTERRFLPLLLAQAFGAFNDNFFRYGLVAMITYAGLSVFDLDPGLLGPLAASVFTFAMFMFSAIAGRLADVVDRTRIMRFAKFAEIWLMLIVAAAFIFKMPLLLLLALFLMGAQSAFFSPAKNAALPTLLKPEELVAANSLLSGTLNVSILVGIGLGTMLAGREYGPQAIGAGLVFIAILGWLAMRQLPPAPTEKSDLKMTFNVVTETIRVVGFAFKNPTVLRPLLGVAWFWMLAAMVIILMPNFTKTILGADESVVVFFSALFTIGTAFGAILCGALSGKGDALPFSIVGALGIVIFTSDAALATWGNPITPDDALLIDVNQFLASRENWRLVLDLGLAAVSAGMFVVPLQAMAQRRAPPALRGRLLAAGGIMNAATATFGNFALALIALISLPIQTAFLMISAICLVVAAITAWRLRARQTLSDSPS